MDRRNMLCSSMLVFTMLGFHSFFASSQVEDDVKCLRGIKDTLSDPQARLATWRFDNTTPGFICNFEGVSCWNQRENRVLGLDLEQFKLSGRIPEALKYCGKSIQRLDLASNSFSSEIPNEICTWMPLLVYVNFSSNQLSGAIPHSLSDCVYLNVLLLSNNELSGPIPYEFDRLQRLRSFSVANNRLSGRIPAIFSGFDREGFEGNKGLYGSPLESMNKKKSVGVIVGAGVSAAVVSLLLSSGCYCWCEKRHRKQ
ncbi:unnamed protein product [Sphenostylis stenocarpa]|uniref:Leucine-rich repeat-containing N-terminal plant-type domain-containing protein n=1 Tax=Sphenostylis stenocarpa TaxID=92480 RepID=A0AA86T0A1_9FABA|nr:unnamed protein product [Sphenostylis stenocarpa]